MPASLLPAPAAATSTPTEELERRAALTEILARVSHEALQAEGVEELLRRIVGFLVERLPVAVASIILLDEDETKFVQEVWAGTIDLELPTGDAWPVTMGVAGRCARTGEPQLILDVDADPDYVPGNLSVRSEYLVPIRHRDRIHGVLNLESTRTDVFTADARRVFDAVADQVAGAIHLARVVHQLEEANRELERLSTQDALTGIANRRAFDERLETEWRRLAREGRPLALLFADADCFKLLNDARGHAHGDDCLRRLADVCATAARRAGDLVARYGGEELAVLLPGTGLRAATRLGERLRRAVEAAAIDHPASTVAPVVTISVGVAALRPAAGGDPDDLVATADAALYAAKDAGRNRVVARRAARRVTAPSRRSGPRSGPR